jgi:peptidoglycan/LPS O-acetylase OafA/YrhL
VGSTANLPQQKTANYRPDIDGLRALAVVPVVLFHAKLGCPGGFVGVDIFFVISGYLISSLILKELASGTFSLLAFWERRIRRILPALAVVVFAVLVAARILFFPADFKLLGESVVAQAILLSNVFFYRQWNLGDGYFGTAADAMPLLHTWTLAVEEQFYLFFPLLLLALTRFRKGSTLAIACVAICSFIISIIGIHSAPAAAFYLLPARAWELLLGVLLAMTRARIATAGPASEAAGWLGIGLIGYAISFYNAETPFPGWAAVPPCLGATLIIYSSESRPSLIGRILSWKPLVFIGLISYSLYLWHWPILVFSKFWDMENADLRVRLRVILVLASIAVAILSWKFVETPFRKRRMAQKRTHIFAFAAATGTAMLIAAFFVIASQGMPSRFSRRSLSYINTRKHWAFRNEATLNQAQTGQFPELGAGDSKQPVFVVLWGDSHAMSLAPVLDELCRNYDRRGVEATHSATGPIIGYINPANFSLGADSIPFNQAVLDYITRQHVRNIVIAGFWNAYLSYESARPKLLATVRAAMNTGGRVYVVKDVPLQDQGVPWYTAIAALKDRDVNHMGITPQLHEALNSSCAETFQQISRMGATVLDPAGYFLNSDGLYGLVRNDRILYVDYQHLTVEGSEILYPLFEPIFRDAK